MNVRSSRNFDFKIEDLPIPHSMTMKVDLYGRVKNLEFPKGRPLLPLFEAISNSIHAIEDSGRKDGKITIRIIRDHEWLLNRNPASRAEAPILNFEVEDNGIGFTSDNFNSFETCDSLHKQGRGAKGIGRLQWLKAFQSVSIRSQFLENTKAVTRNFTFQLPDGVRDHQCRLESRKISDIQTQVVLRGYKQEYAVYCPKRTATIADKLLLHLATNFLNPELPNIELRDDITDDVLSLNERFKKFFTEKGSTDEFDTHGHSFRIHHLRITTTEQTQHSFQLAANFREVKELALRAKLPVISEKLTDSDGQSFCYLGIITSPLLDERVNPSRTGFNLPVGRDLFEECPTLEEIISLATKKTEEHLAPFLEASREIVHHRVDTLIAEYPAYRALRETIRKNIDNFPANASQRDFLDRINQIQLEEELKTDSDWKNLLAAPGPIDSKDYNEKLQTCIQRVTAELMARLAQYVGHRKSILDLFFDRLNRKNDETYDVEGKIHELIFPPKTTSNDPGVWVHQNLWLIDERLAYHCYLTSDKSLRTTVGGDSLARPDLLIFHRPAAFSASEEAHCHNAVTIIEFKRPGRYARGAHEKSPFEQIFDYIRDIKRGTKRDWKGRPISVSPSTAFYVYLICDFVSDSGFERDAQNANLGKSVDGYGYFGFNEKCNAYVEMISFDKLVNDAKQRNRIFFQKMGIHETCVPTKTVADIFPPSAVPDQK